MCYNRYIYISTCKYSRRIRKLFSFLPNERLDGGAHHAGEQEERGDQDVEEGQRSKGNRWGQIGVFGKVNVYNERLREEKEAKVA